MLAQASIHDFPLQRRRRSPVALVRARCFTAGMTNSALACQTYIDAIRRTRREEKTEHSDRAALEALLNAFSPPKVLIQHEPIRQGTKGSPDFKVTRNAAILGYV
jgi:hypothetical protein